MSKRKLRPYIKIMAYVVAFTALFLSLIMIEKTDTLEVSNNYDNYEFVNSSIFTSNVPVVAEEKMVIKPYVSEKVEISKKFYDQSSTDEEKKEAIIFYKDTYMQNSGILYKSEENFDVITILDGTVISVKKDEVLGNVVQVKHSNNVISIYQGLSTVNVKKDQLLKQGDIIGRSGKLELGESLENALLFELIKDGKYVNPLNYYDKKVNEI